MIGWIANVLQITGLVLLGNRITAGWLFGIAAEILWIFRASSKDMPDLMFISVVYIGLASFNWIKWRRT
jgi:hypothetical protein